ncbi:hypothetical protein M153_1665400060, partial [Pseudoloma neurophilia]
MYISSSSETVDGHLRTSPLLKKKCEFLQKYAKFLNVTETKIYTNKFFLDIPSFINCSFKIDSKSMLNLVQNDTTFQITDSKLILLKSDNRSNFSILTNLTVSEKINITDIEEISLDLDDPLLSIEPRHDFFRFLGQLDIKTTINLKIIDDGTLICKVDDFIKYEYKQTGCKITLKNIENAEIKFKTEEIYFLKDLTDTSIIFCVFDEFFIIYSYEQDT